ncbi:MAG: replication protein [Candidatus Atribacteria bacterium]|nr:replication protein [Candidatus Atribacteria bacterium]
MANPQKENGHTDIANEILEELGKTYLSSYESRVLFIIFRKTYGWHKKEDWITNTQISEMTGIAESHISRTIKKLIQRRIVTKNGKKLSFQKDYEQWEKLPIQVIIEKLPKQDIKLPKQVIEVTQTGIKKLPKQVDTKEIKRNYTKETITKEKGDNFINTWKDFKDMRKENKKKMTPRAEELILNELEKLSDNEDTQIAILNQSIMNSWQGVFPLKDNQKPKLKMTQEEALKRMEVSENDKIKF